MFKAIAKKANYFLGKLSTKAHSSCGEKEFMKILVAAESCDNLRPGESSF
jgi:hypothetical protein